MSTTDGFPPRTILHVFELGAGPNEDPGALDLEEKKPNLPNYPQLLLNQPVRPSLRSLRPAARSSLSPPRRGPGQPG